MYCTFCINEQNACMSHHLKKKINERSERHGQPARGNQCLPSHYQFAASLVQGHLAVAASLNKSRSCHACASSMA